MDDVLHALFFFFTHLMRGFDGMFAAILTLSVVKIQSTLKNFCMTVLFQRTSEVWHIASSSCTSPTNLKYTSGNLFIKKLSDSHFFLQIHIDTSPFEDWISVIGKP